MRLRAQHDEGGSFESEASFLSDGVTNTLPVGTRDDVHLGWRVHSANVRHALEAGFYQGWDVHPAQLVSRYATVYTFFREGWEQAARPCQSLSRDVRESNGKPVRFLTIWLAFGVWRLI